MSRTIIVSDLHVETWTNEPLGRGARRQTKLQHWCDFLTWCEVQQVDELIVNGDLMDAPPYQGNVCFTADIVRQAVTRLLQYGAAHTVTYVYGNHDIGISGLRCADGGGLVALRGANFYYPDYVLATRGSVLLLQHGHLYDPALLLYVRDLDMRTYLKSNLQAFQWVQQRRDPETGKRVQPPGVASPAAIGLGKQPDHNVYYAVQQAEQQAPPTPEDRTAASSFIANLRRGVLTAVEVGVKHLIWREAARSIVEDYLSQPKKINRPVLYCLMGHTHVPDHEESTVQGKPCLYFNSGTWTSSGEAVEDRQHATYLDVDADGKVWLQDWIRDPYPPPVHLAPGAG